MSNSLTADWDLMQAVPLSAVNAAIAGDQDSGFSSQYNWTEATPASGVAAISIAGSLDSWSISAGSGQNMTFTAALTIDSASLTPVSGSAQSILPADLANYDLTATIEIDSLYWTSASESSVLGVTSQTKLIAAQIWCASKNGGQAQTLNTTEFDDGGHINDAFTNWCQSSLPEIVGFAFATVKSTTVEPAGLEWLAPTTTAYAITTGQDLSEGVFAVFAMTENRQPSNPAPVLEPGLVPAGSAGVVALSTDRFLNKMLLGPLAQNFVGASPTDFSPVLENAQATMATALLSNTALTAPPLTLDPNVEVEGSFANGGVQLTVSGNELVLQLNDFSFYCPPVLGLSDAIQITLDYTAVTSLQMAGDSVALGDVNVTASYSVATAEALEWIEVGAGILAIVLVATGAADLLSDVSSEAAEGAADVADVGTSEASGTVPEANAAVENTSQIMENVDDVSSLTSEDVKGLVEMIDMITHIELGEADELSDYFTGAITRIALLLGTTFGAYAGAVPTLNGNDLVLQNGASSSPIVGLNQFVTALTASITVAGATPAQLPASLWLDDGLAISLGAPSA